MYETENKQFSYWQKNLVHLECVCVLAPVSAKKDFSSLPSLPNLFFQPLAIFYGEHLLCLKYFLGQCDYVECFGVMQ